MKKVQILNRFSSLAFIITISVIFLLQGCKTDELKEQVLIMGQRQALMAGEKDSLLRLLETKRVEFDTLAAGFNNLSEENKSLLTRVKSLQAGYNSRGVELKKAAAEKTEMTNLITVQNNKNDSLQNIIVNLDNKIAELDSELAVTKEDRTGLIAEVQQKQSRITADSLAEVARLNKPVIKDYGYINITEIGGGFGLGDTNVDYSTRLISFNNIFGYKINKQFLAGLGVGLHSYNGGTLLPLYIDMRYFFKKTGQGLFLVADGGYLLNPSDFGTSHVFVNPAIGMAKKISPHMQFNMNVGALTMQAPTGIRSTFITIKGGVSFTGKNGPTF